MKSMLKKTLAAAAFAAMASPGAYAVGYSFTGTLSSPSGLDATDGWASGEPPAAITYNVSSPDGVTWTYQYTFTVPTKEISHMIIELSPNFSASDLLTGSTPGDVDDYDMDGPGKSNPGLPESFHGIKFDTTADTLIQEATIITTRMPEWGDFYAKDGVYNTDGSKIDVYAYNSGFAADDPIFELNDETYYEKAKDNHILRPDTATMVPIPAAAWLFGSALLGMAGVGYRRKASA